MRLIDADAIFPWYTESFDFSPNDIRFSMNDIRDNLNNIPTFEPRKGKITYTHFCEELWGKSSICGLCGCSWQIADDGEDNFCPNCGCRMEEGDSE